MSRHTVRYTLLAAGLTLGASAVGAQAPAPTGATITGVVRERLNDVPLSLATVSLDGGDRVVFTRGAGAFALSGVPAGVHTLHVRQIGFAPATQRITVPDTGATDAGVTRLERLAVSIASVEVRAQPSECVGTGLLDPGADSMATMLLARLADQSDRLRAFAATYRGVLDAVLIQERLDEQGRVLSTTTDTIHRSFVDMRPYHVGRVTWKASRGSYGIRLPTAAQISSVEFVAHHCARYAGTRVVDGDTLAVLEIAPTREVRVPDVAGVVLLTPDGALRRTELRLTETGQLGFGIAGGGIDSFVATSDYRSILGGRMQLPGMMVAVQQTRSPYVVGHQLFHYRDTTRPLGIRYSGASPEADTRTAPTR